MVLSFMFSPLSQLCKEELRFSVSSSASRTQRRSAISLLRALATKMRRKLRKA
jgi:hypothetical protein